jgi:uncharacterized membrane protein YgcG
MAIEKVIDIKIQGNADEAVGSLRSQLRAAQADVAALSEKFGVTSQQAVEAAKKAGELKDRIGDAKALTDAFNPDAKFKALSSSLAGVAGGFAAVQGGMALLGVESESVEKTLLKVQSAMALSQGLQTIGESVDSFKQLSAVVQSTTAFRKLDTLATAAATVVQRLFSSAVTTTAVSFNALKTAIVSTGIGALVVGLGYLVAKMNESSEATEELSEKQKELNKQLEYGKELAESVAKGIDYNTQIELASAKQRGASDKELTQIRIDGVNARLRANNEEVKSIEATQKDGYKLTKEQNKRIQELRNESLDLERKGRLEIANFNADQAVKEREEENKNGEEKKANKKQREKDALAQAKKDAEELLKLQQEYAQKARDLQREESYKAQDDIEAAKKANADALLSEQELAIQTENEAYQIKYDNAVKNGFDTEELEIQHLNNLNAINLTAQEKAYAQQKEAADKEMALDAAIKNAKRDALDTGLNILMQFAGKNKAIAMSILAVQKGLAIADVIVGAAKGIAAAQASLAAVPAVIGVVPNPMYAVQAAITAKSIALTKITAGTSIASIVAAAIGQAGSISGQGGSGGGGGSSSGGASGGGGAAPQFNVVGNSGVNQLAGVMANREQTPVKAYVVPSDVTTGQSLDRNIIRNASLG